MNNYSAWIITIIAIILSAFFSGMEIAFLSSNRVRASIDVNRGGFTNRILQLFYSHTDMVISTLLVGNNIVLVVYGIAAAWLLEPVIYSFTQNTAVVLILQTIISTLVILFTGEFIPKMIFRINPNSSLKAGALPLVLSYWILYPISWFSSSMSGVLMRLIGVKEVKKSVTGFTVGELEAYIEENIDRTEEEHKEVEHEVKIFHNALDFSNTHLRDCMIPRNEIVAIDIEDTTRDELVKIFTNSGLSKLIVYKEDIDDIVGCIHVSELFDQNKNWKEQLKPVVFAPETMLAQKMMRQLLSEKKSVAIVVDEFGGTAGMVTLEDLVEEIFGEIEDEHDRNRELLRKINDSLYEFSGRAEIDHINDKFHLDIPENDEYQTIAGYILYNLEEIPDEGEEFYIGNLKYTILKKSASRIEKVRVDTGLDKQ
ncbi:MAG: HlyC/CorC family transporter [Muribaculaceae bacterium]|nr:HlyC/CorC family transporter [Muribaculaceae bacterium]